TNPVVLLGDFNYPQINWVSNMLPVNAYDRLFYEFCSNHGLDQLVLEPTYRSGSILDLVFITEPNLVSVSEVVDDFGASDHTPVKGFVGPFDAFPTKTGNALRNYSKANYDALNVHLSTIDWDTMFGVSNDVNAMLSMLYDVLDQAISLYVPPLRRSGRKKNNNWSRATQKLQTKLRRLHKKYKLHPTEENSGKWRECARLARLSKRKDVFNTESEIVNSNCPKKFFRFLRSKFKVQSEVPCLKNDNKVIIADDEKTHEFNQYFQSVFCRDNQIPLQFAENLAGPHFSIIEITEERVLKALNKLSNKNSFGPDGLPQSFIRGLSTSISKPLTKIFHISMQSGKVPDKWKISRVLPMFKKGRKNLVSNYRPISLLCVLSKALESIVKDSLVDFMTENDLFDDFQFGFTQGRSIITNLLKTINEWTVAIDKGNFIDALYLDFAKAFDTVCHSKLIECLKSIGISGSVLLWIKDYLTGRYQFVELNGVKSTLLEIFSGVPQGSLLGPILFLIFIKNIRSSINFSEVSLFADDAKVYFKFHDSTETLFLQEDLTSVFEWSEKMQLSLAIQKCFVLHLGFNNPKTTYSIHNMPLSSAETIRDLGIEVSSDLKFAAHITQITNKCIRLVHNVFRSFQYKEREFLIKIFCTFIRPILEYGSEVWNPYHIGEIKQLERVQRLFSRKIIGLKELSYVQRLESLGLKSLEYRRLFKDLVMTYKIIYDLVDLDYHNFFVFAADTGTRSNSKKLYIEHSRLDVRKHFFPNRIKIPWNALSEEIVTSASLAEFKSRLSKLDLTPWLLVGHQ
ncbi:MAG: reverse transcriptase family protein, partial [Bacteroidota bacterium]